MEKYLQVLKIIKKFENELECLEDYLKDIYELENIGIVVYTNSGELQKHLLNQEISKVTKSIRVYGILLKVLEEKLN